MSLIREVSVVLPGLSLSLKAKYENADGGKGEERDAVCCLEH